MPAVRGHGEGTVYALPNGTHRAVISLGDGSRRSRVGRTRAEALRLLAQMRRERDAGLRGSRMTLGAFLATWLIDVQPTLAPKTFTEYRNHIRGHLVPALGGIQLDKLTVPAVRHYLHSSKLHPQTVQHHRATLRRALNDAVRDGLIPRNVAALAKPPAIPPRERAHLDAAQMRRLFESTETDRLHAAWVVLGTTGLRSAELLGLAWSDVDLAGASLTVHATLHRANGEWVLRQPKTRGSRRVVSLTPMAVAALRDHQRRQRLEQAAASKLGREGLVFTTVTGQPVQGSNLVAALYRALDTAGLPRVGVHGLRHSAASVLLEAGVPMRVIADILGHSTVRITADLYAHVGGTLQRDAAERMEQILGKETA